MNLKIAALGACLVSFVNPAVAHRFDEYLQSTLIAVESDRINVDVHLTPGVAVTPTVIAAIDTNGDGAFSDAEQRAYAAKVIQEMYLSLNRIRLVPKIVTVGFPSVAVIKEGCGEIHLGLTVDLPPSSPDRKLRLENNHQSGIAVYQVNSLVSRDPKIQLGKERRGYSQSVYELEYTQHGAL
jgi:hypothetical protein